jgi:hypothetical protein
VSASPLASTARVTRTPSGARQSLVRRLAPANDGGGEAASGCLRLAKEPNARQLNGLKMERMNYSSGLRADVPPLA